MQIFAIQYILYSTQFRNPCTPAALIILDSAVHSFLFKLDFLYSEKYTKLHTEQLKTFFSFSQFNFLNSDNFPFD